MLQWDRKEYHAWEEAKKAIARNAAKQLKNVPLAAAAHYLVSGEPLELWVGIRLFVVARLRYPDITDELERVIATNIGSKVSIVGYSLRNTLNQHQILVIYVKFVT